MKVDEVIAEILVDLDRKHATYQLLHEFFHAEEDDEARHTHSLLIQLCYDIKSKLKKGKDAL